MDDSADHAEDFSKRYAVDLDRYCAERLESLGIPPERTVSSDHTHGIPWCAFNPRERSGGGVTPDGRINVDFGVLNPELLLEVSRAAGTAWSRARLRDRIDASIAHEIEEHECGSRDVAVQHAPDTSLPITPAAWTLRRIIRDETRAS